MQSFILGIFLHDLHYWTLNIADNFKTIGLVSVAIFMLKFCLFYIVFLFKHLMFEKTFVLHT